MTLPVRVQRAAATAALLLTLFAAVSPSLAADLISEDFTGFDGSGFASAPAAGQLDSGDWRVLGLSDGDGAFGADHVSGDFARGSSAGGVTTGGIYAFDVGSGNIALGVQSAGSDFTPGSFDLRVENTTGSSLTEVSVSYDVFYFNDQDRGNSLNFAWSTDDATYTAVGDLDFTTPEVADSSPSWASVARSTTLSGLNVAAGDFLYLRFSSDDVSGGGSRDEFAIDNVVVSTGGGSAGGLTLSKTGPANVEPEDTLVYDISVGNTSVENDITGLVVTDTLPADVSYVSDTSGVTPTNPSAGVYEWDFGTLAAEGGIDFSLTVEVAAGASGELVNQVEASGMLDAEVVDAADQHATSVIAPLSIHQVQGEGLRSPFAPASGNGDGDFVALDDNIVTALADNGFFLQMPDDRDSSDLPLASRGIFVYTAGAPTVAVGDRLTLGGNVAEFYDSTQITNPTDIDVLASGEALPEVADFDAQMPSPDPESPSCGVNNFECFEGMRVRVAAAFVTAPNQSFGSDPVAEAVITASGERSLREPGVEYPGLGGTCPQCAVWDGNPEAFEIDFDRLGLANAEVTGGTRLEATGVLGYEFSDYEIWPTDYTLTEEPALPVSAPTASNGQVSIASLNVLNLFDTVQDGPRPIPTCDAGYIAEDRETPSQAEYDAKLDKVAGTIIDGLDLPDVIAFQEVESADVLDDLAARIDSLAGSPVGYESYLVFGNDRGNINNGYLVDPARVAVDNVETIDAEACLSSDNTPLHDRPSLQLEARFIADGADWPFVVINNHMRSLGGIEDETRTRLKRHEQSQSVAARIQDLQTGDPSLPVVVIGDMNAFQFSDGYVDVVGLLSGTSVIDESLVNIENDGVPGFDPANQVDPVLHKPIESLPAEERYSFIFQGISQALDHALLSGAAQSHLAGFGYARGNVDVPEAAAEDESNVLRSSDHDGLVVILDPDGAGLIFSDRFETD